MRPVDRNVLGRRATVASFAPVNSWRWTTSGKTNEGQLTRITYHMDNKHLTNRQQACALHKRLGCRSQNLKGLKC